MTQDSDGFLWLGTQFGLNRYDGGTFRSSWLDGSNPSPVSFAEIESVFEDSTGQLWVGTNGYGIARYDRHREQFELTPYRTSAGEALPIPEYVWGFTEVGGAVVAATSQGLASVERSAERFTVVPIDGGSIGDCPGAATAVWTSPEGELWVGTGDGCLRALRPGPSGWATRALPPVDAWVRRIAPGRGDTVWVATDPGGLWAYNREGRVLVAASVFGWEGARAEVWDVRTDAAGDTWAATRGGLALNPAAGPETMWYGIGRPEDGGLPHDQVMSLYEDRQGVLWVGTWEGLARLSPYRRAIQFIPRSEIDPELAGVVAIAESADGGLLVGGLGGSVALLPDPRRPPDVPLSVPAGPLGDVFSLAVAGDGEIWMATMGTGVHRWTGGRWRRYGQTAAGLPPAPDDYTVAIMVDRRGEVWAGTGEWGLLRYDAAVDRFVRFRGPLNNFDYAAAYIWPILEDRGGTLWFGANSPTGGVHSLSPDRSTLATFLTGTDSSLPNAGRVVSLALAGDSLVWFGTQGGGLGRLDRSSGTIRHYTISDGLPDDVVSGVIEDRQGYLWVSTENGLARFDAVAERFWLFREGSGLQSNRFYFNATLAASDGRLYFGGPNGLTVVDPEVLVPPQEPPRVVLRRFLVHGEERLDLNNAVVPNGVNLAPAERFFALELAALDFVDVTLNRIRYRLEPLESEWVEGGGSVLANYTSIPPNEYVFMAQVRGTTGEWNEAALRIPIVVVPYYYETWWFRFSVLAAVLALVVGAYEYRVYQLNRVSGIRLDIAADLHNEVGPLLRAILSASGRLTEGGDTIARALEIQTDARASLAKVRQMLWNVKEEHDSVSGLVEQLESTTKTLLGGRFKYTFDVEGTRDGARVVDMELRRAIHSIFSETLQNIEKHADGVSCVRVLVTHESSHVVIEVTDDGRGFDRGQVKGGYGLGLMEALAARHRLELDIGSRPGTGTRVRLKAKVR